MIAEAEVKKAAFGFIDAVRNVMDKSYRDKSGVILGTKRTWGYVTKINDTYADGLMGTVDVQEYDYDYPEGYHQSVYVSALMDNKNGLQIMPSLYSDVVIAQDPTSLIEYVVLFSHVDVIQLRSHTDAMIGVVETEAFVEGEGNDKDMQDLEATGNSATSTYTKSKILHQVKTSKGSVTISMASDGSITIDADNVTIKGGTLNTDGNASNDACGPYCAVDICPYSGMVHRGSSVSNT